MVTFAVMIKRIQTSLVLGKTPWKMLFIVVVCNLLDPIGDDIFNFESVNGRMRHPVHWFLRVLYYACTWYKFEKPCVYLMFQRFYMIWN